MRSFKRKSERGRISKETSQAACKELFEGKKFRETSVNYGVPLASLSRYYTKFKSFGNCLADVGYSAPRLVYSVEQEQLLVAYIIKASKLYFGLTPIEVRKLAYEYAQQNENISCNIPNSWHTNKQAGKDWLTNFLKRNNNISIKTPKSTSMARASAFNSHNLTTFFNNLLQVQNRLNFEAQNIWNVDETGCTTVQHPNKVLAEKGTRQVGTITSAGRGVLVTVCCAVSATGNTVPPFFLFPRAKLQQHLALQCSSEKCRNC